MSIVEHNIMTTIAATVAPRECVSQPVQRRFDVFRGIYPVLTELGLTLAKDKTWIGRVAKGFDFLGYRLSPDEVSVAVRSFKRMTEKLKLLYERGADQARRRSYVTHWLKWAQSGVVLNKERLLKTTTNILQDTFGFHQASVLLPE